MFGFLKDFSLEKFGLGVYINAHEGAFLGVIFIVFILVYSLYEYEKTVCEFLKETTIGKLLAGVYIITFIAFVIKNTQLISIVSSYYPQFLTYFQLIDLLEIILITAIGFIIGTILIYYLTFVIMIRWLIFCLLTFIILAIIGSVMLKNSYLAPEVQSFICLAVLIYTINVSDDIKRGVNNYLIQLKRNLTCWFKKDEN